MRNERHVVIAETGAARETLIAERRSDFFKTRSTLRLARVPIHKGLKTAQLGGQIIIFGIIDMTCTPIRYLVLPPSMSGDGCSYIW